LAFWLIDLAERKRSCWANWLVRKDWVKKQVETGWLTPNRLTFVRFGLSLMLIGFFLSQLWNGSRMDFLYRTRFFIFLTLLIAAATDALDGPMAREYAGLIGSADALKGVNLDRHADKLLTLPILAAYFPLFDLWTKILVSFTIGGDILATLLAILAKKMVRPIASNRLGKAKMALLCFALFFLVLGFPQTLKPFQFTLVASSTLGLASLASNVRIFIRRMSARKELNAGSRADAA
ncbi:MAG: CDP-alcohol phosphatidyltransferase family protein, partial [Patescibacteria group bacterium]